MIDRVADLYVHFPSQLSSDTALLMSRVLQPSIPLATRQHSYTSPSILRHPLGRSDARSFISSRTTTSHPQRSGRHFCTRTQTLRDPATGENLPPRLIVPVSSRCVYCSPTLFASLRMTVTRLLSHPASDLTVRGPALFPLSTRPVRDVAARSAASGSTRAWRFSRQYTTARAIQSTARACCSSVWWTRSGTARRAGRAFMSTRKSNKRAALVVIGRAGRDARMIQFKTSSVALLARCRLTIVSECPRGRIVRLRTRCVNARNAAVVRLALSG